MQRIDRTSLTIKVAGVCAAAVMVLAAVGTPQVAAAADSKMLTGSISCYGNANGLNIGTESTAKGRVAHAIGGENTGTVFLRAELGNTVTYVPWGWTFWRPKALNFYVFAEGSVGAIQNGSLKRFCTVF